MLLGKNCQSVGGGPQVFSANLDLSSFVQKAIVLDEYSAAVVNSQLLVTVNKAIIDQSFYMRDWSSPNCAFVLEKAGL